MANPAAHRRPPSPPLSSPLLPSPPLASSASSPLIRFVTSPPQVRHLFALLKRRQSNVLTLVGGVRLRAVLRLCLAAMRAYAAESLAWRGARSGVLVAARAATRHVARAAFVAWKLIAIRNSEERERTAAISAVVTERLAAAEGHFASLLARQLSTAALLKSRLADVAAQRSSIRLLGVCWQVIATDCR